MGSMVRHEVYPHAPVALVAVEARHSEAPELSEGAQGQVKRFLSAALPLPQPLQRKTITHGPGDSSSVTEAVLPRFVTRDRTTSATFGPQSVVVETTRHKSYSDLADVLRLALDARQTVAPVDGLTRLGLRYINEIRVPDPPGGATGWDAWVSGRLTGQAGLGNALGVTEQQWQGVSALARGAGRHLLLRYGPSEGYAVAPGALERPTPSPGEFFLLDIDSFWQPVDVVPEFSASTIMELCADLHEAVTVTFETLITDRLREEVLRRG